MGTQNRDDFLEVSEVAAMLRLSSQHVRDLIHSGDLVGIDSSKAGAKRRTWRIHPDEVARFVEARSSTNALVGKPERPRRNMSAERLAMRKQLSAQQ